MKNTKKTKSRINLFVNNFYFFVLIGMLSVSCEREAKLEFIASFDKSIIPTSIIENNDTELLPANNHIEIKVMNSDTSMVLNADSVSFVFYDSEYNFLTKLKAEFSKNKGSANVGLEFTSNSNVFERVYVKVHFDTMEVKTLSYDFVNYDGYRKINTENHPYFLNISNKRHIGDKIFIYGIVKKIFDDNGDATILLKSEWRESDNSDNYDVDLYDYVETEVKYVLKNKKDASSIKKGDLITLYCDCISRNEKDEEGRLLPDRVACVNCLLIDDMYSQEFFNIYRSKFE